MTKYVINLVQPAQQSISGKHTRSFFLSEIQWKMVYGSNRCQFCLDYSEGIVTVFPPFLVLLSNRKDFPFLLLKYFAL